MVPLLVPLCSDFARVAFRRQILKPSDEVELQTEVATNKARIKAVCGKTAREATHLGSPPSLAEGDRC